MEHNESYSGSARVRTTEDYLEDYPEETGPANTFGNAAQDVGRDAQKRGREVFGKVADEAQSVALRFHGEGHRRTRRGQNAARRANRRRRAGT